MRTALDTPEAVLDEAESRFVASIRQHGWYRTEVSGDDEGPGFSYTTGFGVGTGQPELILFAVKSEIVHDVFWDLFRDAAAGRIIPLGLSSDGIFGHAAACTFPVAQRHHGEYLGWSNWFYGRTPFSCLQIVWADRSGVFPWQAGFDRSFEALQPDLTEHGWAATLEVLS